MQGWADDVDFANKTVTVEESVVDAQQAVANTGGGRYDDHSATEAKTEKKHKAIEGTRFDVAYDKLVVSVGCYSQTFGTKGVKENAFFLKDVGDARKIRKRVLDCFEIAALPTTSLETQKQLLNIGVVGGGPTGMEFAAELHDLIKEDLIRVYPTLKELPRITVYDVAPTVLSMFDENLSKYAVETYKREGIRVATEHHVEELKMGLPSREMEGGYTLVTKEEGEVGMGMVVWSTGNMMNPFVQKALEKCHRFPSGEAHIAGEKLLSDLANEEWMVTKDAKTGAMVIDDHLRVQLHTRTSTSNEAFPDKEPSKPLATATMTSVFALGDNATLATGPLPATAQTANQQAVWLGKQLNAGTIDTATFSFNNMGIMTYMGNAKGVVQTEGKSGGLMGNLKGRAAWLVWRGAYLSMSVSWRNRVLICVYWFLNWAFGRDISRF